MTQACIEFSSQEELHDFIQHARPFIIEESDKTLFGLFTELQLDLAMNGFNARVMGRDKMN